MRHAIFFSIAAILSLSVVPSYADKASANACAGKLPPEAKQIYAATIGDVAPGVDLKEAVRGRTKGLVMGGKLSRDQARPAAEAAGECLKLAR